MEANPVKHALVSGGIAVGTMVFEFTVPSISRIVAAAGADFVMFDMEHTGLSTERLGTLAATAAGSGVVPLVRVPSTNYQLLSRVLEVGARGVMLPNVQTPGDAAAAVEALKYPPRGHRGTAFGIAHDDYLGGDALEKMRSANEETLVIAQIESEAGVSNAEDIAAVDGIDVLWVGHNDLTTSFGITGQFEHARYLDAVDHVLAACDRYGISGGFCPGSKEHAIALLRQGFRCLAYRNDIRIYIDGLCDGIEAIRSGTSKNPGAATPALEPEAQQQ